ncbi:putative RNA polymerase ECF-type sigma factor [Streptomyces lydicamycinicus]|uniref:Putative RNA polymerase ECF-type sigma factor n=1 Tax=Streptomyces lydicamycinicus TaxID=1546107 RepID=A0A0P4RBT2_9ACTN|nr:putative RNA polymerase ECF-type sigma factor [Streptomyces lydicamycinicus]
MSADIAGRARYENLTHDQVSPGPARRIPPVGPMRRGQGLPHVRHLACRVLLDLKTLTPAERVVFVLREVFDLLFGQRPATTTP